MLKKDKKTFVIYLTISFTLLLIAFGLYYFFMVEFDKLESERMIFSLENTLNGSATRSTDYHRSNFDEISAMYEVSEGGVIKPVTEVPVQLSDFGTLTFDKVESINSRANLFYLVNGLTQDSYIYQMGSNYSGYYQFELKVKEGYSYKIYLQNHTSESNLLPLFSSRIEHLGGYFYYINTSSLMRTRYFHVVIEEGTPGDGTWGLTDYHNTWDKP